MIHYTCDRCQRSINPDEESRYLLRIDVDVIASGIQEPSDEQSIDYLADLKEALEQEMFAAAAPKDASNPLDDLHEAPCRSEDIGQLDTSLAAAASPATHASVNSLPPSYDLCPQCYAKFLKNPLSRERSLKLHFSNN